MLSLFFRLVQSDNRNNFFMDSTTATLGLFFSMVWSDTSRMLLWIQQFDNGSSKEIRHDGLSTIKKKGGDMELRL